MTETELFITTVKAAVNGQPLTVTEAVDTEKLWQFSRHHAVSATVASALLGSDLIRDDEDRQRWSEAMFKSIRKTVFFDKERAAIYRALENQKIWYVPLKGIVVNSFYPVYGVREFSDNDIWVDGTALDRLETAMKALGYQFDPTNIIVHYSFHKEPLLCFEFHHRLFSDKEKYAPFNRYFEKVKQELTANAQGRYALSLSAEDSYIFLLAHAYKHYVQYGVGLKTLADIYLYRKHCSMDENKLATVFEELQIAPFVRTMEKLTEKLLATDGEFAMASLTEPEREMLENILRLGNDGNLSEYFARRYEEFVEQTGTTSRLRYYQHRLFPSMEPYKKKFPTLYKHKILHPLFYVYRTFRGLIVNRRALKCELKTISKGKKKQKKQ